MMSSQCDAEESTATHHEAERRTSIDPDGRVLGQKLAGDEEMRRQQEHQPSDHANDDAMSNSPRANVEDERTPIEPQGRILVYNRRRCRFQIRENVPRSQRHLHQKSKSSCATTKSNGSAQDMINNKPSPIEPEGFIHGRKPTRRGRRRGRHKTTDGTACKQQELPIQNTITTNANTACKQQELPTQSTITTNANAAQQKAPHSSHITNFEVNTYYTRRHEYHTSSIAFTVGDRPFFLREKGLVPVLIENVWLHTKTYRISSLNKNIRVSSWALHDELYIRSM